MQKEKIIVLLIQEIIKQKRKDKEELEKMKKSLSSNILDIYF